MESSAASFHLEEYKQIRTEVSVLLARIEQLFRYSLIVSATVIAWLLTSSLGAVSPTEACLRLPRSFVVFGWLIPPAFVLVSGLMVLVTNKRIHQMGEYLESLERALGTEGLGWERFLGTRPSILTWSTAGVWLLVFAMVSVATATGIYAAQSATQVCKAGESR